MARPTITITLDKVERRELEQRIRSLHDRKQADQLRVILYKADGLEHQEIAHLLQMGRNRVSRILQEYTAGGIEAVLQPGQHTGSAPRLTPEQQAELKVELSTHLYATAQQVIAWVKARWGVEYEVSGMHKLLKRLGFTYKKNRLVPSKADPELQRLFVRWYQGLCQRLGADDRIYFCDAAHFKHNAEAGYAWSLVGHPHAIPTNSGRQRYNVLGAYCVQTHEYVLLLTEKNINQERMVEFIIRLRVQQPTGQLYLIVDNASYNHAHEVETLAHQQRVRLEFLPPYSPNLNPIERLWKFTRKEFFKDKYRDTFAKFRAQLDGYRDQLVSLITDNFEQLPDTWQLVEFALI
jgi:transposase